MRRLNFSAAIAVLLTFTGLPLDAQTGYVVVVNDSNPISSISNTAVTELFLKKITKWDSGLKVQSVDQAPSRSVRESFTRAVHGKSVNSVRAYWQTMIFSGKSTPPPELDSDSQILEYVRQNSGAMAGTQGFEPGFHDPERTAIR